MLPILHVPRRAYHECRGLGLAPSATPKVLVDEARRDAQVDLDEEDSVLDRTYTLADVVGRRSPPQRCVTLASPAAVDALQRSTGRRSTGMARSPSLIRFLDRTASMESLAHATSSHTASGDLMTHSPRLRPGDAPAHGLSRAASVASVRQRERLRLVHPPALAPLARSVSVASIHGRVPPRPRPAYESSPAAQRLRERELAAFYSSPPQLYALRKARYGQRAGQVVISPLTGEPFLP